MKDIYYSFYCGTKAVHQKAKNEQEAREKIIKRVLAFKDGNPYTRRIKEFIKGGQDFSLVKEKLVNGEYYEIK